MNKTIEKINNKIKELNLRLNQLSYSPKNIKFYYANKISEINQEILDLKSQVIYYSNCNSNYEIDLHGATKYFVKNYLDELLYYKMNLVKKVKIITGKGTFTLYNCVKKYIINEKLNFIENNFCFIIIF